MDMKMKAPTEIFTGTGSLLFKPALKIGLAKFVGTPEYFTAVRT
jgi:hypothetical protein